MTSVPKTDATRRITLVSTMKNEGPYLLEWLAYHKSIGITDFCIFSNDCTDGTNLILNRLDQLGVIRHFDNPLGPRMDPQRAAYSRAGQMDWVIDSDWVLVVDADEFLNVRAGNHSVQALIDACPPGTDAISLNWRLMGSCGQAHFGQGLVTERFIKGSSFSSPENGLVWGFKTLFRPHKFDYFGVHRPKFEKSRKLNAGMVKWVNGDGIEIGDHILGKGWRSRSETVGYGLGQINHYAIKSREDFLLKRLRGTANSKNKDRIDLAYWNKFDINTIHDASIRTDGIQPQIDAWLQDADLAALMRACIHASKLVLAYQKQDNDLKNFVDSGVFPPPREAAA